ncbi:MAG: carbon-nitrogen hydrolase family protein [Geminicoccaceae bacterium]|nr:carbon-nitrogen hydrolase family protein [Geminicoccaceae bacterium]
MGELVRTTERLTCVTPFAIAGIQMHISALHSNLEAMIHRIDLTVARFPWVRMIMFSELAAFGPLTRFAHAFPSEAEDTFRKAAERHGVWLLPGSMFERDAEGRIFNTASVIAPTGDVLARYRKLFPFRPYEHDVDPGEGFCVFDVPEAGRFGVSICYDMWIPETSRTLTSMGAEVILHPVLTGTIDRDIELSIARSTAAQFQCYVFDINGLAAGGVGRSCVVDPAGTVICQAAGQEEYLTVEIDFDRVRRQREVGLNGLGQVLKSFRDRKFEFDVYDRSRVRDDYLASLGPLELPSRDGPVRMAPRPGEATTRPVGEPIGDPTSGATGEPATPEGATRVVRLTG